MHAPTLATRTEPEMVVHCSACGQSAELSHHEAERRRPTHCGAPMRILHNN
jgi:hypothetical protein